MGMTKAIKFDSELGEVNKEFGNLKSKVENFLDEYDENKNQEIDLEELKNENKRKILAQDLANKDKENKESNKDSKLQEIIDTMKELEKKVIKYRQGENIEGEKEIIPTEPENQELEQQIKEKVKKIKEQKAKEKNDLEIQLSNCQQIKSQLFEEKYNLSLLKEKKELTDEEEELLNDKIEKLKKDLSEAKKKAEEIKKEQQTGQTENAASEGW